MLQEFKQAVRIRRISVVAGLLLLGGCAQQLVRTPVPAELEPLRTPLETVQPAQALASVHTPGLQTLTDEMREFADRYVRHGDQRQRLRVLHRSLISPALVGIDYNPAADGSAADAFRSGEANCLTYAHLFVALARYSGLDARYLSLTLRPQWSRHGERLALRRHVNVLVRLRNGEQYMVDIDPVPRARIAGAEVIDDDDAFALYHGNLAMDALLREQPGLAFAHALRAIELSRTTDYLWVNLGAIYRRAGQDTSAEQAYHTALQLNPGSGSAMNNLAVLYQMQGDLAQAAAWESRVERHRERNPYYHYSLGEQAEAAGDLPGAVGHFREAIALKDSDAEFYFRLARLYLALQQPFESVRYAKQAVARSQLVGEREQYQKFLDQLPRPTLAQVTR